MAAASVVKPAVVPGKHAAQNLDLMAALGDAVALPRIADERDRDAEREQPPVELGSLLGPDPSVLLSVQDQRRRPDVADLGDR